jgi:hypothetical protein
MGKSKGRSKGPRRAYLKRFSASAVNAGQRINGNLHYQLNRSHIESKGVPDTGQSWNLKSWKDRLHKNYVEDYGRHDAEMVRNEEPFDTIQDGVRVRVIPEKGKTVVFRDHDPIVKNRPQRFQPIPATRPRLRDQIYNALDIDPVLARNMAIKRIENKFTTWHEIVFIDTEFRKLALYFYANVCVFIDIYKDSKKMSITRRYPNSTRAMEVYKAVPVRLLGWGPLRPYS